MTNQNTAEQKIIKKKVMIDSKADLVWYAWTKSDRVSQWFAGKAIVEPEVGGKYELYFEPGNEVGNCTKGCTIIGLEPFKSLSFTWKGPDPLAELMNQSSKLTEVNVTLQEIGEQTEVTVTHTGWGEGQEWQRAIDWHVMAWDQVLSSLKSALEAGEGELCCQP
ncbi:MAG TPA: SRPBCC domain-containing protein [Bacillus sp. (in: firmicutes)]|uniref:SRPBCC family protein n=1 Tax=Bacillus litorisediminis TaxID=2922713 RepID=UPI001FAEA4C9|nr:SRPBCC domain-containing protein [Bacillus litorisediminis]HWO77563.1 SRPBCC domain-containing protein [Bacillus sp. (in: firmicutes)]